MKELAKRWFYENLFIFPNYTEKNPFFYSYIVLLQKKLYAGINKDNKFYDCTFKKISRKQNKKDIQLKKREILEQMFK